jgi:hypothetical protein
LPPKNSPEKIKDFLDHVISQINSYRLERFGIWERVRLFKQGYQWLSPDYNDDPTQTPFWKVQEMDESNWSPLPVQNEILEPLSNETARLQGNGSRPYIKPTVDTADAERGAALAKDVLMDRLDLLGWREAEHEGATSMVDFGTWILKTYWDVDYSRTIRTPVLDAMKCPGCGQVFLPKVPDKRVMGLKDDPSMAGRLNVKTVEDLNNPNTQTQFSASVTHCLTCPATLPAAPPLPVGITDPSHAAGDDSDSTADPGSPAGSATPFSDLQTNVSASDGSTPAPGQHIRPVGQPPTGQGDDDDMHSPAGSRPADVQSSPIGGVTGLGPNPSLSPSTPLQLPTAAPGAPQLVPYMPSDDEARSGKDYFGRPLGEDTPLGEAAFENISVFDFFPENQGIETKMSTMTEFGQSSIRTLDWIVNHYPQNGWRVQAEDSAALMKWHPIAGATRHYLNGAEKDLFANHALVREWHKKPWVEVDKLTKIAKLNRGRSLIMAGNVVLMDADYMIQCTDENNQPTGDYIPRVQYQVIPWEIREKEIFGLGAGELILPHQVTINTLIAQVQDARHRFGSPKLLAEEGMDLMYAGFADTGYTGDVLYYRPGGSDQSKPEPFGNIQMEAQWANEYKIYLDSIHRVVGTMDAESGAVPGGGSSDWSAQALMYLGEKAGERRKNRIDRIRTAKRRAFQHMLQLIQEKYRETREYRVKRSTSERLSIRKFKGMDLNGQHDVQFEDEPAYDTRLVRQAAMKDAITQFQTITPDTALAKRKINQVLGAPTDINDEQNKQVERAIDEWCLFFDEGLDPAVNPRGDDHTIHFQQHMLDLMSDEADDLKRDIDWNQIELALWGWDEVFDALMAMEQQLKTNPPPPVPPKPQPMPDGSVPPEMALNAQEQWQHQVKMQQTIAAMPKSMELRIYQVMCNYIAQSGVLADPLAPPPVQIPGQPPQPAPVDQDRQQTVNRILRYRAHAEAHHLLGQQQAAQAAGGAQMAAAPGGVSTQSGTIPGNPGQAVPGPGAGPGSATAAGNQ